VLAARDLIGQSMRPTSLRRAAGRLDGWFAIEVAQLRHRRGDLRAALGHACREIAGSPRTDR